MRRLGSTGRGYLCAYVLCVGLVGFNPRMADAAPGDVTVPETQAPEVSVIGHYTTDLGTTDAASQGSVTYKLIEDRPILRPGEILEFVPGMVVTQHSGDGKANQYFLRGYNLDHGTDFATYVEGMPVNMPTNGHGQGYADINFMIPELVNRIDFRKGPYCADEGDFASAGSAHFYYFDALPKNFATVTVGSNDYRRAVVGASPSVGNGHLLIGLEAVHNDGPWENPERFNKLNTVLRLSQGTPVDGLSLAGMAYKAHWNSTDQIPQRAVDQGLIGRLGTIDPSDGGDTSRYSLSFQGHTPLSALGKPQLDVDAYVIRYTLDLFSNFTFFLDDPVNGDQFHQADRRTVWGLRPSLTWAGKLGSAEMTNRIGAQLRYDNIARVGLDSTVGRVLTSETREDKVKEGSAGLFAENSMQWNTWFRSIAGVRFDYYNFDVNSSIPVNSGKLDATITSPKLSLIFGPWYKTELFLNGGYGFHSNDARGTVITVDPKTGLPADPVTPLVRTKGAEFGVRTQIIPNVQSSLAFWVLNQDSELLFTGDAGTTEPSRPSRRKGIEWINTCRPLPWLLFDAQFSYAEARFTDADPAGGRIPGAVPFVAQLGATVQDLGRWSGALQLRYVSPYPLIEDNSVRSDPSTIANLRVGYKFNETWTAHFDVLNLFNSEAHDIDYFYCSRLKTDPAGSTCSDGRAGVDDIHFHPAEPRQFRFTVTAHF
jgi:outer membrane receptor protein involved in Fe transport